MWKDPIVEEVRKVREQHAKKFNYDIHAICEDLRKQERRSRRKLVALEPKRALAAACFSETVAPMKILKIHSLEGRWVDKDEVLLHAAFQLLQDFVEQEHPEKTIDWKHDAAHARAWREISSLYQWWKKTRPARRSPLDDKKIKRPPMRFEPIPNSTMRRIVPHDRKKYRAYDRALRNHSQLEKKWHAEDQRNLHRLVEIRPYLWT